MPRYTPIAKAAAALGLIGLAGSAVLAAQAMTGSADRSVAQRLAERLPQTKVSGVDCEAVLGLCAITAGANLFYTDRSARFLIVGRVYDMETRQDLTAAKLLELNPDLLVGAAARGGAKAGGKPDMGGDAGKAETAVSVPTAALAKLPASGAIQWGSGKHSVTVFSDIKCGYCRELHEALASMKVRVHERPISILGTRSTSEAVLCARHPARALAAAYLGKSIEGSLACDTTGLDANEAFARAHGFTGTPVLVREDGAVIQGYRDRAFLEAWLAGEAQ
ncbi:MAG: DsbC family protein [Pseudomonadota bacterium]